MKPKLESQSGLVIYQEQCTSKTKNYIVGIILLYFHYISRFDTKSLPYNVDEKYALYVNVPSDINKFLFDYNNSKFLECNRTAVEANFKASKYKYFQNETINQRVKHTLKYLTNVLESSNKHYWLTGGTLLGNKYIKKRTQQVFFLYLKHKFF